MNNSVVMRLLAMIGLVIFCYGLCFNKNRIFCILGISIAIITITVYGVILSEDFIGIVLILLVILSYHLFMLK